MATDIRLDEHGGEWVEVDAAALRLLGSDLIIDDLARNRGGGRRRALVHDAGDGLTINFAGDYPGGVTLVGDLSLTGTLLTADGGDVIAALRSEIADLRVQLAGANAERLDRLDENVAALAALMDAVIIPAWRTKEEVERGDDMGLRAPSADELGLVVAWEVVQADPRYEHEEIVRIEPRPGGVARRGSTVQVTINLAG